MRLRALAAMVGVDLRRTRGPLFTAGFGIAVGVAALAFFLSLGLGARKVLLGDVFPIDQVELEPQKTSAGLLSLLGGPHEPAGVDAPTVEHLRRLPGVAEVYPKLRFRFPSMAKGGKELLGREIGTHEMVGDGIEPELVAPEVPASAFLDPLPAATKPCAKSADCDAAQYCELPSGQTAGRCSAPVPAIVSRYLVELFDHAIAPAHGLPPVAETLVGRAQGVVFDMTLGNSLLGVARQGTERKVKVVVVGISPKAIDLGVTLPVDVVRRWNREYAGDAAADKFSSVVVKVNSAADTSHVLSEAATLNLMPKDTRARDVSVLITAVLSLLLLVAGVILLVAALNISHTFRVLVAERAHEIGLYRALGASSSDMRRWLTALALVVGAGAGAVGALIARLAALVADWRAAADLPDFPFKPESFFVFPPWLWALSVGFAALFALAGAALPARRAARTDPSVVLGRDR
ncbi:MAG: ABC transporter permease [Polyangiaceae bacterium]|nr:ABC transporter permease [Polyangiaceae bacterium]